MEKFYLRDNEFNYTRYNSLPGLADYILDHPKEYYDGWGVTPTHKKPTGIVIRDVKPYEKIFLNADLIIQYLTPLTDIKVPFHLITGNTDVQIHPDVIKFILTETKMATWSGHNFPKIDDRFLQIPMGFTELGSQRPNSFTEYVELPEMKIIPLVVTPFSVTHDSRTDLYELSGKGILNLADKISYQEFLTILGLSKYSACPRGNALDSHRFVESILMGSVPIVLTSDLDPLYEEMGGIIIDDWEECKEVIKETPEQLNRDVVTLEYWNNRMMEHHKNYEK